MDWLMNNPIADMYGPKFLLLYITVIIITMIACRKALKKLDTTLNLPIPKIPTEPDPYEIAYLRGAENEVTRVVIFSLLQRGYLHATDSLDRIGKEINPPDPRHLTPIESTVFNWFTQPRKPSEIFSIVNPLSLQVKQYCSTYEKRFSDYNFFSSAEVKSASWRIWFNGALVILGLGG